MIVKSAVKTENPVLIKNIEAAALILLITRRPSFTICGSDAKSEFNNTRLAVFFAASLPDAIAMPAAITITEMITIINNIGHSIGTPREMLSTVCVLATGWVYLITLRQVYSPMTGYRKFVIYLMQTAESAGTDNSVQQ